MAAGHTMGLLGLESVAPAKGIGLLLGRARGPRDILEECVRAP